MDRTIPKMEVAWSHHGFMAHGRRWDRDDSQPEPGEVSVSIISGRIYVSFTSVRHSRCRRLGATSLSAAVMGGLALPHML